jgi:DNA-binding transcriptional ArsR family regulator
MLIIMVRSLTARFNMRAFKYINDPEAFELVADETRRRIIHLLRAREMTVSQIADALDKTPPAIYHQIRKLVEGGFVEASREERVGHFVETYYRATAEIFEFIHGGGTEEYERSKATASLRALTTLDLGVASFDKKTLSQILEIEKKIGAIGRRPGLEDRVTRLEDIDIIAKQDVYKYAQLATMSDKEFEESLNLQKKLRHLLKSGTSSTQSPSKSESRAAES